MAKLCHYYKPGTANNELSSGFTASRNGRPAPKVYSGFQFDTDEEARTVDQIILKFDEFAVGSGVGIGGRGQKGRLTP